jgi:outer membrane biosynthesis protein TonB
VASRGATATSGDGGVTSFARPLGGYQTKPRYPESALRASIQGVTRLRFEVLTTGQVGRVLVDERRAPGTWTARRSRR